jgi:hypothetical protein
MSPTLEFAPPYTSFPIPSQVINKNREQYNWFPLLVALGITTGAGTGWAGMGISISEFARLSKELTNRLKEILQQTIYRTPWQQWSCKTGTAWTTSQLHKEASGTRQTASYNPMPP